MSYILDALRRADAERERGAVPSLHAQQYELHGSDDDEPRHFARLLPWLVAGVAVLLLAVGAWVYFGREAARPTVAAPPLAGAVPTAASTAAPVPTTTVAAAASAVAPAAAAASAAASAAAAPRVARKSPPARRSGADGDTTGFAAGSRDRSGALPGTRLNGDDVDPRGRASTASRPYDDRSGGRSADRFGDRGFDRPGDRSADANARGPNPSSSRSDLGGAAQGDGSAGAAGSARRNDAGGGAPDGRILNVRELPDDVRKALPNVSVSGSTYSTDRASRMLMINGQIFREGDAIAAGLVLQQIRPRGAVFGFRGYRYEIGF